MAHAAQTTDLQVGDGGTPELFTTLGELVSVAGPSMAHEMVDVSNLTSAAAAFLAAGVVDSGEVALELHFDEDAADHLALLTRITDGASTNYQLCWSNLDGHNFAFLAGDVIVLADTITENNHGLTTGQPCYITTDDTMPPPLVSGTTYYVIWVDVNTIELALTNADAVAGTQIDITGQGVGNHACHYGDRYDFAAYVVNMTPAGAVGDKLSGSATLKIDGAITANP